MVRLHSAGPWAEKMYTAEYGHDRLGTSTMADCLVRMLMVSQPELVTDLLCWLLTDTKEKYPYVTTVPALRVEFQPPAGQP